MKRGGGSGRAERGTKMPLPASEPGGRARGSVWARGVMKGEEGERRTAKAKFGVKELGRFH